jgi:hypothetical protein
MILVGPIKSRDREGLDPESDDLVPARLIRPQMFVPYYHQLPPLLPTGPAPPTMFLMAQIVT